MGRKKYTAPEDPKGWAPIVSQKKYSVDCEYSVLGRVLAGCIHPLNVKKWLKKGRILSSCEGCELYVKVKDVKKKKFTKTKQVSELMKKTKEPTVDKIKISQPKKKRGRPAGSKKKVDHVKGD